MSIVILLFALACAPGEGAMDPGASEGANDVAESAATSFVPVDANTRHVVTLAKPPRIPPTSAAQCPHLEPGLLPWNPAWVDGAGNARIPEGARVLVNGNQSIPIAQLLRRLVIPRSSELIFADVPATFQVTDILVQGALTMGSPSCRLNSAITFRFVGDTGFSSPKVQEQVYLRAGLGIRVERGARLDVHGRLFQPTWTRLAQTADAGSNVVTLEDSVDWQAGQRIVVVTSALRDYPYADENELRTITSVAKGGRRIGLDAPLAFRHYGGDEYQVEVALLSRGIVFETEAATRAAAPHMGAHVSISGQGRVSGVELRGMGQQNLLGRYPLHFHMAGDVQGSSYFTDNSVWDSNWRCISIHSTHNAIVSRNVGFDVFEHCYYVETGDEVGNEISYNLAAKVKIIGPTDEASLAAMNTGAQEGFTLWQSAEYANPADRAASGFYITNGNNRIFGNAASGGFAGYSFPSLPRPIGRIGHDHSHGAETDIVPKDVGVTHFIGNSAHTAGYFWRNAGCVYAGGVLTEENVNGQTLLKYQSGRPAWNMIRWTEDRYVDTRVSLCELGVSHWGVNVDIENIEVFDSARLASLFGSASVHRAVVDATTANAFSLGRAPIDGYRRGFQFYDTSTQTILSNVVFRNLEPSLWPGGRASDDNCAFFSMTHSDEFTPEMMSVTERIFFDNVEDRLRFCHDDTGTLSSRNFNFIDTDGTATAGAVNAPLGPRLVGSGVIDVWNTEPSCVLREDWNLWICPKVERRGVAAISTTAQLGVSVHLYGAPGRALGANWYPSSPRSRAHITGPSSLGWHMHFANEIPDRFGVWVKQVPQGSFVLLSFDLPRGRRCTIPSATWTHVDGLATLLGVHGQAYAMEGDRCFVKIPPMTVNAFTRYGLSVPGVHWPAQGSFDFEIVTGCAPGEPACQGQPLNVPSIDLGAVGP